MENAKETKSTDSMLVPNKQGVLFKKSKRYLYYFMNRLKVQVFGSLDGERNTLC